MFGVWKLLYQSVKMMSRGLLQGHLQERIDSNPRLIPFSKITYTVCTYVCKCTHMHICITSVYVLMELCKDKELINNPDCKVHKMTKAKSKYSMWITKLKETSENKIRHNSNISSPHSSPRLSPDAAFFSTQPGQQHLSNGQTYRTPKPKKGQDGKWTNSAENIFVLQQ